MRAHARDGVDTTTPPQMTVDFTKCRNFKDSIIINGSAVEQVNIHKSHGLTVMNILLKETEIS